MTVVQPTSRQLAARRFTAELPEVPQLSAKTYAEQLSDIEQLLDAGIPTSSRSNGVRSHLSDDLLQFEAAAKAWVWDRAPRLRCLGNSAYYREHLIATYSNAYTLLRSYRRQVDDFIEAKLVSMIDAVPRLDINERQTGYDRLISIMKGEQPTGVMPDSVLTADIAALPPEELVAKLESDLRRAVDHLVSLFFRLLRYGIQQHWFGLATWMSEDICRFTFSTAELICHPGVYEWNPRQRKETWIYRFDYRAALHEHHLMGARCVPRVPSHSFVPERYWPLLESMPDFIRPQAATLDGWLIRERIVARDLQVPDYAREVRVTTPVRPPDLDPAVLLGPVVLFAWSEREFTAPTSSSERWQGLRRAFCRPTRPYFLF
jgi:hypothetical protein